MRPKCNWLEIAVSQRNEEVARGEGLKGTTGYADMGCYHCDGRDSDCKVYRDQLANDPEWFKYCSWPGDEKR